MSKFLKRSAQGAGVPHEKRTSNLETVVMPLPSKIVVSMSQHIGAPAAPAVAKGDQVYVGSVIGKAGGFDCLNAFQHIVYNIQLATFTVEIVVGDTYDKIVAKFLCATQKVDVPLM